MLTRTKKFITDFLFPQYCLNCQKEGNYLCEDCKAVIGISALHQKNSIGNLKNLYFAVNYQNPLIKNLIQQFKYKPFIKELAKTFSSLIIDHFKLIEKPPDISDSLLLPVPLFRKRLKWRGFNQAEEIGKELSKFLEISLITDCLIKTKETRPQIELSGKIRKENVKGVFLIKNKELIKDRKIILIDDVYTTGATMVECAKVLKESGVKEIIGIVVARG